MIGDVFRELFTETFEGVKEGADGTMYVQGGEALEDTLASLSAEEASKRPFGQASSIAAHIHHMAFYIENTLTMTKGGQPNDDWASSWLIQEVDARGWQEAKIRLIEAKRELLDLSQGTDFSNEDHLMGAFANLAHVAYHLGAVRQLYLAAKSI